MPKNVPLDSCLRGSTNRRKQVSSIGSSHSSALSWVGTIVTVLAAQIDLGPFNIVVALLIATIEVTLVVLFFMHVKYTHEKPVPLVIVSAIFFMGLLLALSMADYGTRLWH